MKKNLFLLLSVYCFVIQPILAGILWGDINFYYFGGINIVLIALIAWMYFSAQDNMLDRNIVNNIDNSSVSNAVVKNNVNTPTIVTKEGKPSMSTKKTKKKKIGFLKWILFFASVLWIVVTSLYLYQMMNLNLSIFIALISGFLWFWVLSSLFNINKWGWFFVGYRYLLLLASLVFAVLVSYSDLKSPKGYFNDFYRQTKNYIVSLFPKEKPPVEVSTGVVLDVVLDRKSTVHSGDVATGGNILVNTGVIVTTGIQTSVQNMTGDLVQEEKIPGVKDGEPITMLQGIKYLLDKNVINLDTKTNIRFTHLSSTDQDYVYFKTAYKKKLIGKNTKPDAALSCDIYIVMKGILEGWNVGGYDDIKNAYWDTARNLKKLNGCEKGTQVQISTL